VLQTRLKQRAGVFVGHRYGVAAAGRVF
jgi:hypothetical protein